MSAVISFRKAQKKIELSERIASLKEDLIDFESFYDEETDLIIRKLLLSRDAKESDVTNDGTTHADYLRWLIADLEKESKEIDAKDEAELEEPVKLKTDQLLQKLTAIYPNDDEAENSESSLLAQRLSTIQSIEIAQKDTLQKKLKAAYPDGGEAENSESSPLAQRLSTIQSVEIAQKDTLEKEQEFTKQKAFISDQKLILVYEKPSLAKKLLALTTMR